ncbi:hypothetical protein RJ639_029374 [Escallonia herrerae]|uniref:Transposase (putative) gypsy type domain-containing protein n=1 Tax=Escallonia herrerae TaxID=1293975 RepID=A0AA89BFF9_9ASTE|nr:hypothetical protein RJ639_029374 [Escallonia herrerae]
MEYPLVEGWIAGAPELQEQANYGTDWETGIYEEQVKSGYRLPLYPFALEIFHHYKMVPSQLVPNGWRKLVGHLYLIKNFCCEADPTYFMKIFFELCFVKGVASNPGWYYIHNRQKLLKGGLKTYKNWHSRYFFTCCEDQADLGFDKKWNAYCKDIDNKNKPLPDTLTMHILSHIKLRARLSINEPLTEKQLKYGNIILHKWLEKVGVASNPGWYYIHNRQKLLKGGLKTYKNWHSRYFFTCCEDQADLGFDKKWNAYCKDIDNKNKPLPDTLTMHILSHIKLRARLSINEPLTEKQLKYGNIILHKPIPVDLSMYVCGAQMLSRFDMARKVAALDSQKKREAVAQAEEATKHAQELTKREADLLAQVEVFIWTHKHLTKITGEEAVMPLPEDTQQRRNVWHYQNRYYEKAMIEQLDLGKVVMDVLDACATNLRVVKLDEKQVSKDEEVAKILAESHPCKCATLRTSQLENDFFHPSSTAKIPVVNIIQRRVTFTLNLAVNNLTMICPYSIVICKSSHN